jgi:hypothetical protein
MIRVGSYGHQELKKPIEDLKRKFIAYSTKVKLPEILTEAVFPDTFLSSEYYLVFPSLFKKAFNERENQFVTDLCLSGYLYFKYLICLDSLQDKDVDEDHENAVKDEVLFLRSHVFHQEALKILSRYFGSNTLFWEFWSKRNKEFLSGILLDKSYNIDLSLNTYKILAISKCSFLKTTVDAYYSRNPKYKNLHSSLLNSFDYLAIARCIQDDVEDFKKDILNRKNNYGHTLLNRWFNEQGKNMMDHSPNVLEKYLYISKTAENMLSLSKDYFNLAINEVIEFKDELAPYIKHLEVFRNKCNLVKVNIEAYRITKYVGKLKSNAFISVNNLDNAIANAERYISQMQNNDGSWFDIANKQGLSNVWATGFISSHLNEKANSYKRAIKFLLANRQNDQWGYNTDWIPDYDSTTCVLLAFSKANIDLKNDLSKWVNGQGKNGGFSTYKKNNVELINLLGFNNISQIKGWTEEHVCVSALAYFFLTNIELSKKNRARLSLLRTYLLRRRNKNGVWEPYWWTSHIYSTCFIIKGMINEGDPDLNKYINTALKFIISQQNKDGSFSCDTLKNKSVFYTSLVLDTITQDKTIFTKYRRNALKMTAWLLKKQFEDGAFQGSNMLIIPKAGIGKRKISHQKFNINFAGGNNIITGDVSNLFTTSVTLKALNDFKIMESSYNEK